MRAVRLDGVPAVTTTARYAPARRWCEYAFHYGGQVPATYEVRVQDGRDGYACGPCAVAMQAAPWGASMMLVRL